MNFKEWFLAKEDELGMGFAASPTQQYDSGLFKGMGNYKPPVDTCPKSRLSKHLDKLFKGKHVSSDRKKR